MLYTIGEIAKKLNIAPSTLRYYDKKGLLPFLERSSSGIRVFKDEDFEYLSTIECLKKAGMSIKDIKLFIDLCTTGDETIQQRLDLVDKQRDLVMKQIKEMQEALDMLNYKHWYYETAKKAGTCDIHVMIEETQVPSEFRDAREKSKGLLFLKSSQ